MVHSQFLAAERDPDSPTPPPPSSPTPSPSPSPLPPAPSYIPLEPTAPTSSSSSPIPRPPSTSPPPPPPDGPAPRPTFPDPKPLPLERKLASALPPPPPVFTPYQKRATKQADFAADQIFFPADTTTTGAYSPKTYVFDFGPKRGQSFLDVLRTDMAWVRKFGADNETWMRHHRPDLHGAYAYYLPSAADAAKITPKTYVFDFGEFEGMRFEAVEEVFPLYIRLMSTSPEIVDEKPGLREALVRAGWDLSHLELMR